jgi:hypothetical protein
MPEIALLLIVFVGMGLFVLLVFAVVARGMWGVVRKQQELGNSIIEQAATPTWVKDLLPVIDEGQRLELVGARLEGIPALRCDACGHVDPRLTEFCLQCGERLLEEHPGEDEARRILG